MINTKAFYVYEWFIVETGEIFYVGKGTGKRAASMKDRNDDFRRIRKENQCAWRIVRYFDTGKAALAYELEYGSRLKCIGQAKACHALGGKGKFVDEASLAKMQPTQFKKRHEPWNKGKAMDEAYKARCRAHKLGTKQSAETRRKRSEKLMNHPVSNDVRKRIAESRKKPISVIDIQTNAEKIYDCIQSFAAECGVTQSALSRVVKSGKTYRGRYIIKQVNPEGV